MFVFNLMVLLLRKEIVNLKNISFLALSHRHLDSNPPPKKMDRDDVLIRKARIQSILCQIADKHFDGHRHLLWTLRTEVVLTLLSLSNGVHDVDVQELNDALNDEHGPLLVCKDFTPPPRGVHRVFDTFRTCVGCRSSIRVCANACVAVCPLAYNSIYGHTTILPCTDNSVICMNCLEDNQSLIKRCETCRAKAYVFGVPIDVFTTRLNSFKPKEM